MFIFNVIYWQGSSSVVKFGFSWLGEKTKLRVCGE